MTALKKGRRIRGPKTTRLRESEIAREWRIIDVANKPFTYPIIGLFAIFL